MADDSEWVLESIAGYLSSPDWIIPLTHFMENNCSVFDDEDENKLTYTEIHQQYKQLLLENHMQEVGINEQQFVHACSSFTKTKSLQALFHPVLATDDFQMFRSLMVQKNMELQLQALHVFKGRNGGLPECLTDGVDVMSELEQQEMKILQEVLMRSKEEYDLEMAHRIQEKEEVVSTSSSASESAPALVCDAQMTCDPVIQHTNTMNGTSGAKEQKLKVSTTTAASTPPSGKCTTLPAVKDSTPKPGSANEKTAESPRNTDCSKHLTEEDLRQRSEYLKQQRDKLQALKKDQTPKTPTQTPSVTPDPRPTTQEISVEEKKKLQKRKHLAEKLKEEVIKK
ncbi:cilia- and flagella-associated protein 36 isoform X2 [Xyrauchen texanus]|uniref:cilia- and flagella-associated protein 36 isoform X2 n=1 Tax=Xyrauchen texanus TaxID=154827 RepID=UPI0022426A3D|nr:cilia- and flagella-associated protein 36 isoform X2 [Xyrauchen texanus]